MRLEAWKRKKKHITFLFASFFCFLFLFLSAYILEHAFFCYFLFFFFSLHSASNSLFQFSVCQQLQNQPCGCSRAPTASWSPFCGVWVPGPRGSLSQPLHIRNSHTSLWSLLPIFSMCMIFPCFIFAFLIILHLVNDSYFYLFIFNLVLPHLWNLSSSTRDRTHGSTISAES